MRDPKERLRDILDAVQRVQRYTTRGREAFEKDELIQVWIVHHLQIIGEAAAQLGADFHKTHPVVPWPHVVAMRNVLVHDSCGVDINEVCNLVEQGPPGMITEVQGTVGQGAMKHIAHDLPAPGGALASSLAKAASLTPPSRPT